MVDKLDWLFELADRLSPLTCALLATFGIAVIAYLVFNDWMCKKRREYEGRISDLEEQVARKDAQLQRMCVQNCDMAYKLNDAEAKTRSEKARADGSNKRANKMADEADKYRKMAENVA